MTLQEQVTKYKIKDFAVLENWGNSQDNILCILIFDTKEIGYNFISEILFKNEWGFLTSTEFDKFTLGIIFDDNANIVLKTNLPNSQYDFETWDKQNKQFFITCGVWLEGIDRMFDTIPEFLPINKYRFDKKT